MDPVQTIVAHVKRLRDVRDQIERLDEQARKLKAEKEELEVHILPRLMEDAEVPNLRVDGIGQVYLDRRVRVYCKVEDQVRLHDWLRSNGHGDLIKETVPWNTLSAWGKELLEQNEPIPEFCQVTNAPTAKLRRN